MPSISGINGKRHDYSSPVVSQIKREMRHLPAGLMPFASFANRCLYGKWGFYQKVVRIGAEKSDSFDTAPHSHGNILGSTLGLFIASTWEEMEHPEKLLLVEAGAGHGRMMKNILDFLQEKFPQMYKALNVVIIEISGGLISKQREMLANHLSKIKWSNRSIIETSLKGDFGIFVSNEVLDVLPFSAHVLREAYRPAWITRGRWIYLFEDLHVKYEEGKEKLFKFVPVNEVIFAAKDDEMKEWGVAQNVSLIPEHNFRATEETLAYQSFLLNNSLHLGPDFIPAFVALAPRPLSDYVKNTLGSFRTGVSLFIDYGVTQHDLPRFGACDHGECFGGNWAGIERALEKPGLIDYSMSVDFRWTAREARRLGAEVFTTERNKLIDAAGFQPIPLHYPEPDHFLQIQTKGGIHAQNILVRLPNATERSIETMGCRLVLKEL